jgi:hypothetical protein
MLEKMRQVLGDSSLARLLNQLQREFIINAPERERSSMLRAGTRRCKKSMQAMDMLSTPLYFLTLP